MIIPAPLLTVEKGRKKDTFLQAEKKALLRSYYRQMHGNNMSAVDKRMKAEAMYREGSRLGLPALSVFLAALVEEHTGRNPLKEEASKAKEKTPAPVAAEPVVADTPEPAGAQPPVAEIPAAEPVLEEVVPEEVVEEEPVLGEVTGEIVEETAEEVAEETVEEVVEEAVEETEAPAAEPEPAPQAAPSNKVKHARRIVDPEQPKIILMFGPPGAGKGTQARLLQKKDQIVHLSTGDMLRECAAEKDELGSEIKELLDEGRYAPDELMIRMIAERIKKPDCKVGFTLDGFPRTLPQAEALNGMMVENKMEITSVIALRVGEEAILDRCAGRMICEICGESYHITNRRPNFDMETCNSRDHDGRLVRRPDDMDPAIVAKRIATYRELTEPVIAYYQSLGMVTPPQGINGEQPIYDVLRHVSKAAGLKM